MGSSGGGGSSSGGSSGSSGNSGTNNTGKTVGTVIGSVVAGPIGGMIGGMIGGNVGKGKSGSGTSSTPGTPSSTTASSGSSSYPGYTGGTANTGAVSTKSASAKSTPAAGYNFTPLEYQTSDAYTSAIDKIGQMVNQNPSGQFLDMGQNYAKNVMSDNYSAYNPQEMQAMIDKQSQTMRDQFKIDESRLGSRMANQGLAGSGIGGTEWSGLGKTQTNAISDMIFNTEAENREATRQDKSKALGMLPTLSQMSQIPLQNQMSYANILGQDDAAKNTWTQWNAQMAQNKYSLDKGIQAQTNQFSLAKDQQKSQENAQNAMMAYQLVNSGK